MFLIKDTLDTFYIYDYIASRHALKIPLRYGERKPAGAISLVTLQACRNGFGSGGCTLALTA